MDQLDSLQIALKDSEIAREKASELRRQAERLLNELDFDGSPSSLDRVPNAR